MDKTIINKFAEYLGSEFGYSEATLMAYKGDIALFLKHVAFHNPQALQTLEFTPQDVLSFLEAEAGAGRRTTTLNRRVASLKVFEKFLEEVYGKKNGFLPDEEKIEKITSAGKPSTSPHCLNTKQIVQLWEVLLASPKRQAARDLAFIALMLEWGFSVNLLLSLDVYDVDLKDKTLWTPTLGQSGTGWRLDHSFAPLERYLKYARKDLSPKENETRLFISQQGKSLSRQSIWHALRKWGREIKLEAPLTPRLLRNTAVHYMLGNGVPLQTIGLALGHLNPLSTHLLVRRLKEYCKDKEVPQLPYISPTGEIVLPNA